MNIIIRCQILSILLFYVARKRFTDLTVCPKQLNASRSFGVRLSVMFDSFSLCTVVCFDDIFSVSSYQILLWKSLSLRKCVFVICSFPPLLSMFFVYDYVSYPVNPWGIDIITVMSQTSHTMRPSLWYHTDVTRTSHCEASHCDNTVTSHWCHHCDITSVSVLTLVWVTKSA